jgi:hypothetical protein
MTVCIAAICDWTTDDPKIVQCSDKRSSSGWGTLENRFKVRPLTGGWTLMCAGSENEISAVTRLLESKLIDAVGTGTALDESTIGPILDGTLEARKRQRIESLVQSRYGISYDEFRDNGKAKFPDDLFRNLMYEVHEIRIDIELILTGFASDSPLIFEASQGSGHAVIRDDFAVIGSGSPLAQSVMLHRQHHTQNALPETAYRVFEAKRYAEGETGVGRDYSLIVSSPRDRHEMLSVEGMGWMDETYRKYGPRRIPSDLSLSDEHFTHLASTEEALEEIKKRKPSKREGE